MNTVMNEEIFSQLSNTEEESEQRITFKRYWQNLNAIDKQNLCEAMDTEYTYMSQYANGTKIPSKFFMIVLQQVTNEKFIYKKIPEGGLRSGKATKIFNKISF